MRKRMAIYLNKSPQPRTLAKRALLQRLAGEPCASAVHGRFAKATYVSASEPAEPIRSSHRMVPTGADADLGGPAVRPPIVVSLLDPLDTGTMRASVPRPRSSSRDVTQAIARTGVPTGAAMSSPSWKCA